MLEPAILHKEELDELFKKEIYTEDFFFYSGYGGCHELPVIQPADHQKQYAICETKGNKKKVIGYVAYRVNPTTRDCYNFGLYSFDKNNILIGIDIKNLMTDLIQKYHRIEWRCVSGNPVQKYYDIFCDRIGGRRLCLHDVIKDEEGNYHDEYIYEVINEKEVTI